jgi:3-deoxy-7-phosphoheptulonate synthase
MIVVLRPGATTKQIDHVLKKMRDAGVEPHVSRGTERVIILGIGDESAMRELPLEAFPGVEKALQVLKPFKLVSREFRTENSVLNIRGVKVGGNKLVVVAGPCAVENREILLKTALAVKKAGATMLRGGAFKPRSSPYAFQGLGEEGLRLLNEVGKITGLSVVTEVLDTRFVPLVCRYADVLQIGARNMQNFELLKEVGETRKPVILKRGLSSTIKEWLLSAEYIMSRGNHSVMLCERGIRTYEDMTRNTLDLSAVPVAKELTHLPVLVDPTHATGKWHLVPPMAKAAVAAGADGLMIEVHPRPEEALSDGDQSLLPLKFASLMKELRKVARAVGRSI